MVSLTFTPTFSNPSLAVTQATSLETFSVAFAKAFKGEPGAAGAPGAQGPKGDPGNMYLIVQDDTLVFGPTTGVTVENQILKI